MSHLYTQRKRRRQENKFKITGNNTAQTRRRGRR